jgi:hypothetical protein
VLEQLGGRLSQQFYPPAVDVFPITPRTGTGRTPVLGGSPHFRCYLASILSRLSAKSMHVVVPRALRPQTADT